MKKIILSAVILTVFLSGCQKSPNGDIIDQKGGNTAQNVSESDGTNGISDYEVPDGWQESVTYDNSETKLSIDAEIEIPDIQKLSTYKINESTGINQERIDLLMNEMFGNAVIYDSNKEMTRSEIEDMILRLRQQKAEAEAAGNEEQNGNMSFFSSRNEGDEQPTIITNRSEMFDRMIASYEEMLSNAPETVEDKPLDLSVKDTGSDFIHLSGIGEVDGKGNYSINYLASKKNNIAPSLNIANAEYSLINTDDNEEQYAEYAPSREEAIEAAENLVKKLGLLGMAVSHVSFAKQIVNGDMFSGFMESEATGEYGYIIEFAKNVEGVACINGNHFGGLRIEGGRGTSVSIAGGNSGGGPAFSIGSMGAASIRRGLNNEVLTIGVTKNGIEEISWSGYFEVEDVITDDVALLPFDEIKELFKKNMGLTYTVSETPDFENFFTMNNISDTYHIYKAVLSYTKTAIENDSSNSMLVPVWAFYSYQIDENGTTRYDDSPVMIMNAIDGSVY